MNKENKENKENKMTEETYKHPLLVETLDGLYESIESDIECDYEQFKLIINELCELGILEMLIDRDDTITYKAKTGLKWSNLVEMADPIKRKIILQLIENPQCFFVLLNTQKGKLRVIGNELASYTSEKTKRFVSFLIVDNDLALSKQSVDGLYSCFPIIEGKEACTDPKEKHNVRIFELSTNSKESVDNIKIYIDAYAYTNRPMPLIVLLANNKQIEKLIDILYYIKNHECKNLYTIGGWDEADKTYPHYRNKQYMISGKSISFLTILNDPDGRILRNGFVTATEGDLLDQEYEECENAHHYTIDMSTEDIENYFAFHHSECVKHYIDVSSSESNNIIAERILKEHWDIHFNVPLKLKDGSNYNHKVIINADVRADEMEKFANTFRKVANVVTFNMRGLKLYSEKTITNYSARKLNLNKMLFYIYKMHNLEEKPLIIIGRRKVDRGLGFHYAPRKYGHKTLEIDGGKDLLKTDGIEGLIWTDMIMGNKIEHIPTAVQKAGRGAGIIRQCPQYSGQFHYWIDLATATSITNHYTKVDKVNELDGAHTMAQAIKHVKMLSGEKPIEKHIDPSTTVPIIHTIDKSDMDIIVAYTDGHQYKKRRDYIEDVIKKSFKETHSIIKDYYFDEFTVADSEKAVKKYVDDPAKNAEAKTRFKINRWTFWPKDGAKPEEITEKQKMQKNSFKCFIHVETNRMCIIMRRKPPTDVIEHVDEKDLPAKGGCGV